MRKTITFLMTLMLCYTWVQAQNKGGKLVYSQLGDIVDNQTGYPSYDGGSAPLGTGIVKSADDFTVPDEGMSVFGATVIFNSDYFSGFNVAIYDDNNGIPGEIVEFFNIEQFERVELEYQVNQYTFEFPYSADLTEGTYWLSVVGTGQWVMGSWLTLANTDALGIPAKQKDISMFPMSYINWTTKNDNANGDGMYTNLAFGLVGPPDNNDLTLKSIIAPKSGELTAADLVTVEIQNVGLLTQNTFDVMYQVSATIDGTLTEVGTATETVSDANLAMKESMEYTFNQTADLSALNTYSVKAMVMLSGDSNPTNDMAYGDAKNYGNLYIMGTDAVVTACDGVFVDDGSVLGTYTEASNGTITFYPGNEGDRVALDFTKMEIEGDITVFNIYDGEDTNAPKLYEYVRYSGINPTYVQARNAIGAITVEVLVEWPWGIPGWEATVSCVTPQAIDFIALDLAVGNELDFNFMGEAVNVITSITNAGAETASRKVYLVENDIKVDSLNTMDLAPGEIETLNFAWIPTLAATEVNVKVMVENDPQEETNSNNTVEKVVSVFKPGNLLESFESGTLPLAWVSKNGKSVVKESSYTASHGNYYLSVAVSDTVIMPIVLPADMDELVFDAYPDYGSEVTVLVSESMDGPWEVVGTAPYITWSMSTYSFDVSAWKDVPHYFALTHNGSYEANIDFVRGSKLFYFENDLMAIKLTADSYVKTNVETNFEVSIMNIGINNVLGSQYSIEIRTQDSVYAVINGVDISSMAEAKLSKSYVFNSIDTLALQAQIMFTGEVRTDNNTTVSIDVFVLDSYTHGGETTSSTSSLLQINRLNSISEMIYYPSEVGLYGDLNGIEFSYDMTYDEDELGVPVTFYVATTLDSLLVDPSDYWTPSWIDTDSLPFTMVYSGLIDIKNGENQSIFIPFNEPFAYNGTENLVLIVMKDSMPGVYKYPSFYTMDSDKPRFIYGANNTDIIDPSDIAVEYGGSVDSYQVPNFRFHFDNPGAPEFVSEPVTLVKEDTEYSYNIVISFESPIAFVVDATAAPEWLSLTKVTETTYTLSGTATVGTFPVELIATDGIYSAVQRFDLTVGAVPVFTSTPVNSIAVGEAYAYNVVVTYNGDDAITFTGDNIPSWATLTDNGDGTAILSGTATEIGTYPVSIYANGKYYSANQTFNIDVLVGVNEVQSNNFTVYPNPAKQSITLANVENSTITIYNILGNVVKTQNMVSSVEKINVSELLKGVYMIVMTDNTGKVSQRLVIE